MAAANVKNSLSSMALPEKLIDTEHRARGFDLDVQVEPGQVVQVAEVMDREKFFLEAVTGVDWIADGQYEVLYHYARHMEQYRVVVRARIPRETPDIPTISTIFPSADWHERETHDFFGINFQGHPYLVPLLLPEDADFHPLRKDYKG